MTSSRVSSIVSSFDRKLVTVGQFLQPVLLLAIRLYWGWQFFIAGKGKLMNIPRTAEFFASLHIPLPTVNAYFVGGLECIGGLLLLAGLASRPVALLLAINMTVAYLTAHRDAVVNIWNNSDNFVTQAPFLFLLASLIVFCFGPGVVSIDAAIKKNAPKERA